VDNEFQGASGRRALLTATSEVKYAGASTEDGRSATKVGGSMRGGNMRAGASTTDADRSFRPGSAPQRHLTPIQERTLGNLLRVRALVTSTVAKQDEKRTEEVGTQGVSRYTCVCLSLSLGLCLYISLCLFPTFRERGRAPICLSLFPSLPLSLPISLSPHLSFFLLCVHAHVLARVLLER
jgi:hypothetical protein